MSERKLSDVEKANIATSKYDLDAIISPDDGKIVVTVPPFMEVKKRMAEWVHETGVELKDIRIRVHVSMLFDKLAANHSDDTFMIKTESSEPLWVFYDHGDIKVTSLTDKDLRNIESNTGHKAIKDDSGKIVLFYNPAAAVYSQ